MAAAAGYRDDLEGDDDSVKGTDVVIVSDSEQI